MSDLWRIRPMYEHLNRSKVCAGKLPRLLTPEMKEHWVRCSADFGKFRPRLVIGITNGYIITTPRQRTLQAIETQGIPLDQYVQSSAHCQYKSMCTVFYNAEVLILIDMPQMATTLIYSNGCIDSF